MGPAERSKVQRLYDACDDAFASGGEGRFPTLHHLRRLQAILDEMGPTDLGIDGSAGDGGDGSTEAGTDGDEASTPVIGGGGGDGGGHGGRSDGLLLGHAIKEITYIHIHQCDHFSIGVFCFPAGARLPLHDHPEMVVLTKVLYGSISVRSYDWLTAPFSNPTAVVGGGGGGGGGIAKVVANDCILRGSSKASALFPRSGGNIHSITAVTPSAILDVLAPPYAEDQGRPSNYYMDIPIPSLPGFVILEETKRPDDLRVVGAPYVGPELLVLPDDDDDDDYDLDTY